jgi:stearoyl-CoA desaturase (Delta-9 desaturase)
MTRVLSFLSRHSNKSLFVALHIFAAAAFFFPLTTAALTLCIVLYFVRMFGITAGYHRLLSHRAYKAKRWVQFMIAALGCAAMQKGPLWWARQHRDHHKYSDTPEDPHSPRAHGVWHSHVGWVLGKEHDARSHVRDLEKLWELRLLERLHLLPGILIALLCLFIGGWSGVFWGFFLGTVALYHGTFLVNSVCHLWGGRRFETSDDSRNNAVVAILTLGEGWHNNHHHYQSAARQGYAWWEIDVSFYILWMLSLFGLVWDLRKTPRLSG